MATVIGRAGKQARPIIPDAYERVLALAAITLLAVVLVALVRGAGHWARVPAIVWAHLLTVLVALVLTPPMLLRPRGDRWHRRLGRVWVIAMLATAALSLGVRMSHPGHLSFIHLLSLYVLVAAPLIWWTARTHRVAAHRGQVRGMVTGALVLAGFFTLPFGRLLGGWLFG
ncbi:DUF2306 domain-containing protein [Sphingomonas aracearum]|uniref:DUF2306 domain-containing protein n=1 Tax=Sphingomonas aracearum TaxID=2283317 RepID=A0A369VSC2_9SPHN|nr:hypothetical protein [Sphingomonas aracearum]RDE04769.1 hypothetical protein DVW87_14405 [Sphingomonas aracearum]